jgi:hypothetical protein
MSSSGERGVKSWRSMGDSGRSMDDWEDMDDEDEDGDDFMVGSRSQQMGSDPFSPVSCTNINCNINSKGSSSRSGSLGQDLDTITHSRVQWNRMKT